MFTIPSGLATHMAEDVASLAFAYKITPVGAAVSLYFTTSPVDVTVNGALYLAAMAVTPSSMTSQLGLVPGTLELTGSFDAAGVTEQLIMAGYYDFADIEVYLFNWADISMGSCTMFKGKVADCIVDGRQWRFECVDMLDKFSVNLGELTSATCRAELFDTRCKVPATVPTWLATTAYTASLSQDANSPSAWVQPTTSNRRWYRCSQTGTSGGTEPTWNTTINGTTSDGSVTWTTYSAFVLSGTVTSKLSNQIFSDAAITEADGWWQYGKVVWSTGANAGLSMEIKSHATTVIELYAPMPYDIAAFDTFTLRAGCAKTKTVCKTKFSNLRNMRAEPDKPSNKLLTQFGER